MNSPNCNKCIFPRLRGCPVGGSFQNAACLSLYKSIDTCQSEHCSKCRWLKYCKEKGRNLNEQS